MNATPDFTPASTHVALFVSDATDVPSTIASGSHAHVLAALRSAYQSDWDTPLTVPYASRTEPFTFQDDNGNLWIFAQLT
jgi:hypothetical protein